MESSRVGMGMGMRMVIGMGMVIPVASGPYARRFSFLTTFTRSCLSKRSFLLRPKLKPSPSIIIPHARSKNSIDVDDLSVFRFTLGIVGFDESYLPRIIGILFGFLLVLNHVSTQTSVTAAQLRSEFVGIFLVAISISIPYVGKRLKGTNVARQTILPVNCREVFLIAECLSDVDKEDLAWGSYALLRNTLSMSLVCYYILFAMRINHGNNSLLEENLSSSLGTVATTTSFIILNHYVRVAAGICQQKHQKMIYLLCWSMRLINWACHM
ncbi:protein COFACTOR ASSEMBLY OF COMPLEX C SUBUNIT B CCB2, chloroplastic isoform X2 [Cryptomeria japonica]|uniref:protein COFACTOR ASSEMBLY OF COMPLEX C SUBUNIT B CCB2, chloroplastic isoform X2 n=1 Tax=Cryptomeria japonica TaxID=3369 RepID=UPI0027DA00DB|nr:protein COFACTOR ASSEMBLY OF COMPLEX C SUBUNIT B CCB2, chloroplastic isoform X2 [Cryptomeria japonica]